MKISVIGCGRWGSFIAWYLDRIGHEVLLYGRAGSAHMEQFLATRSNGLLTLPHRVGLTSDLAEAAKNETIVISIASQGLREQLRALKHAQNKLYVLCMKGLEIETGLRLSEVVAQEAGPGCRAAVWLGPGHVQEFLRGVPNCMVIDAELEKDKRFLVEQFSGDLIRFYYGEDMIGNEVGAAAKNVVGIAAGLLDGYDHTSLKGALMSRGTREYARLIKAMGGHELSAYGLCHLGDYEATLFSPHSNNRNFGIRLAKGESFDELAEGCHAVRALTLLAEKTGVDLPITRAVHGILYEGMPPFDALDSLFSRSLKQEFYGEK